MYNSLNPKPNGTYWSYEDSEVETVRVPIIKAPSFTLPVHTIDKGRPIKLDAEEIKVFPDLGYASYGDVPYPLFRMRRFMQCIDSLSRAVTQYKEVVHALAFHELYPCEPRDLPCDGGNLRSETFTCLRCRHIFPVGSRTFDHQRPKKGGEREALVKSMRVIGLTVAPPHGQKCVQLYNLIRSAMENNEQEENMSMANMFIRDDGFIDFRQEFDDGIAWDSESADVPSSRRKFDRVQPKDSRHAAEEQDSTVADRYTLNPEGKVFYSLLKETGLEQLALDETMHSLTNLRPLCWFCNGKRGNRGLKFV